MEEVNDVYNVHSLCHVHDEVAKRGTLDNFLEFQFGNFLGFVKNLLRKSNLPLSQFTGRISVRNIISVCENMLIL